MNLAEATITQVLVPVEDFERGVAFYREVLSIPFLFTAPPQMAFFQCGTVRLLVGVTPSDQTAQRGSMIYFGVKNIQSTYSSLSARGVRFKTPAQIVHRTQKSELWLAEFVDPDGNQLALMSEVSASGA